MKRIISILLASSIAIAPISRAKANPAVLAPAALCSTGVGCVLVGVAVIGGVTYYVWKTRDGRRVKADHRGNVFKHSERGGDSGVWDEPIAAKDYGDAENQCTALAKEYSRQGGVRLIGKLITRKIGNKTDFRCVFTRA